MTLASQPMKSHFSNFVRWSVTAVISLACGCATLPPAQQNQKAFSEPEAAVKTLASAIHADNMEQLMALFGPQGKEILSSGDPVADRNNRQVLAVAMDQQWRLQTSPTNPRDRELVIGDEQWPFPIPLVKTAAGWQFDTPAGKRELLARRIGRNELAAISVCRVYVVAQKEYAEEGRDGKPAGIYAQKVRSTPGKHDGLHWKEASPAEEPSPLSDLAAQAEATGYTAAVPTTTIRPFNGYFFRILSKQGKDAPGGAKDYVSNGEMTGGFALVAYPAEYGSSGIMTFIVASDGIVYQADLGDKTAKVGLETSEYNPDVTWSRVK